MTAKKVGDVDLAIASMTPRAVAIEASKRVARAEQRQRDKVESARVLLAELSRTVKGARSWKAAMLARLIADWERDGA